MTLIYDCEIKKAILKNGEQPIEGIDYCINDVRLTHMLFHRIKYSGEIVHPKYPDDSLRVTLC